MKLATSNQFSSKPFIPGSRSGEQAAARIFLVALVSFGLGVAATAVWFHRTATQPTIAQSTTPNSNMATEQSSGGMANGSTAKPTISKSPQVNQADVKAVKSMVPNFADISLEDGENILRTAALKEFTAATKEMNEQVTAAQQKLLQAKDHLSSADQQAAIKQIRQIQSAGSEKLQQISADLQAKIAALESLKKNNTSAN